MQRLELTLASPAANLALDEALTEAAEASGRPHELLRLWEPAAPLVVIGRASRADEEVRLDRCRRQGVPVLRRTSGGAAVVVGPGCLLYSVLLSYERRPQLRMIDQAHAWVLDRLAATLGAEVAGVARQGVSDLTVGDRKVSGNSVRCRRTHLLYHGTLLYDFHLPWISEFLATPPRQPDYRAGRPHADFVANLPLSGGRLRELVIGAFGAVEPIAAWPEELTAQLVAEKYQHDAWNLRR